MDGTKMDFVDVPFEYSPSNAANGHHENPCLHLFPRKLFELQAVIERHNGADETLIPVISKVAWHQDGDLT
jgi:hypothetical protein